MKSSLAKTILKILISLIVPVAIVLWRPLGFSLNQSIVFGALILVIIWWTTGITNKTIASIVLLAVFIAFGQTPLERIFSFALSEAFIVIILSFLFSQGIINSKLAEKLLQPLFVKYATSALKLMAFILVIQLALIIVIPQSFSRIILIALILIGFFDRIELDQKAKGALMFWLYASTVIINMSMLRGDLILNPALIVLSEYDVSESTWIAYMMLPTVVFYIVAAAGFLLVFRKELATYSIGEVAEAESNKTLGRKEVGQLTVVLVTVVVWATESFHGISGTIFLAIGTVAMVPIGLLKLKDLKSINLHLLCFLTAALAIGPVLRASGVSDIIFSELTAFFPTEFSLYYVVLVFAVSVLMHMLLGSNVTTMSVVIPSLLMVSIAGVRTEVIIFIIYFSICAHFVLPFHHAVLMIGNGYKHYDVKTMVKFAPVLTVIVAICLFALYYSWWFIAGLL